MGKLSRTKGQVFERSMVKRFRQVMPGETIKRGLQARGGQCDEVPDVDMPALWIECKHGIKPSPRAALEQATRDSKSTGKLPVAIIKDNRKDPFVVMDLDDFLHIVAEWWQRRRT